MGSTTDVHWPIPPLLIAGDFMGGYTIHPISMDSSKGSDSSAAGEARDGILAVLKFVVCRSELFQNCLSTYSPYFSGGFGMDVI
jgi:hypothetical protein